jgi:hypothetical protein
MPIVEITDHCHALGGGNGTKEIYRLDGFRAQKTRLKAWTRLNDGHAWLLLYSRKLAQHFALYHNIISGAKKANNTTRGKKIPRKILRNGST